MTNSKGLKLCLLILTSFWSSLVFANLLIYPTRVSFDESTRAAQISLTNTSKTVNTYRLEWLEKVANPAGGYIDVADAEQSGLSIASSMVRFSPRQVTLKPGERQMIKLMLRRPAQLAEGEYRSHLNFKALPPPKDENKDNATSMQINMLVSFAIPVTVRQGQLEYQLNIDQAELYYDSTSQVGAVVLQIARSGRNSVLGNWTVYWKPDGGTEVPIAKSNEANAWPDNDKFIIQPTWMAERFVSANGQLRVEYKGVREFDGKVFIDQSIRINKAAIKPLPTNQ
ncbi:fimbria/pilus periplasmic chaperone [Bowmanella sp. Y26]|uniref:fimbrial biogenesis chaperone n=1 Tax=Bowmanella yangjiangensis TaxID=2811230 RepID=UPI001BDC806D|nr:fimbria/pilus periplasmic chaperone [Bowmanella yangjiangensis]MBT1065218.1 fimbria/pilus periplasmic chaperone [Bowmanella yangjiangensis]